MSLITEALKKSERETLAASKARPEHPRKTDRILAALAIACLGAALVAVWSGRNRPLPPTAGPAADMEGWRLNGVLTGAGGEALALLNGKVVQEGARIGGVEVVRIGPDEVELRQGNRRNVVRLR